MIAIVAKLKIKEGKEEAFEKVASELVGKVNESEPGNLLYRLCKGKNSTYTFIETYTDQAALDAHGKTEYFRAAGGQFKDLLAGAPEIETFPVVAG